MSDRNEVLREEKLIMTDDDFSCLYFKLADFGFCIEKPLRKRTTGSFVSGYSIIPGRYRILRHATTGREIARAIVPETRHQNESDQL